MPATDSLPPPAAGLTKSCQTMTLLVPTHRSQDRKSNIDISPMLSPKLLEPEPQTHAEGAGEKANRPDGAQSSRPCFSHLKVQMHHLTSGSSAVSGSAGLGRARDSASLTSALVGRCCWSMTRSETETHQTHRAKKNGDVGEAKGSSDVESSWFGGWRAFSFFNSLLCVGI